jgi:crotonobetainyl-CoA:carnitine CoA-transferase CaiB-like acyl-CoA transferase
MARLKSPLEGIRVLDLGRYQAGPRCAMVLARLGAEVIKVEGLRGDESRENGPFVRGQSAYWVQYNSGKKSITLNLRKEEGKEILRRLVKLSDVFIQNFRPGVIERMGFGYEVLRELNPRIIMVNISAYGQFGPYRVRIGFDPIGQAIGGHMYMTGWDGLPPITTHFPIIDRITALHGAIGVLAALREREFSGEGQALDVALADSGYSLTEIDIAAYVGEGLVPKRHGNRIGAPPNNTFRCKDGWVYITAGAQDMWRPVCETIGRPEWVEDPRFASREARRRNADVIEEAISQFLADKTVKEAVELFTRADIAIAPVNDIPGAAKETLPWERRVLVEVPDPVAGKICVSGDFWHFSRSEVVVGSAPTPGQHTEEVLTGLLGLSREEVERLRREGVI